MTEPGEPSDSLAAFLIECEMSLLDPAVRGEADRVAALLAEDFEEFGSSGRVWNRARILDLLASEGFIAPAVEDLRCVLLNSDTALITYQAIRINEETGTRTSTLRSSLWVRENAQWRIRFHQGTVSAQESKSL